MGVERNSLFGVELCKTFNVHWSGWVKSNSLHLYTGDWLTDPALSLCTPATRGVWVDLICYMHRSNQGGKLIATREQLARYARCSSVILDQAISELQTTRTADIYERNGTVTVI